MPEFEIHPDIGCAWTLPSRFYTDPRFFELSKEKIFAKCWHFLGRDEDFETLRPVTLLPDFLDEPVLLSKVNGSIVCLSNVCTHRGKVLIEESCEANLIRCGYHGRRFSLDGKFISMPEFEGVENFPGPTDDLHRYELSKLGGFLFSAIDQKSDLSSFVGPPKSIFDEFGDRQMKLTEVQDYTVNCHWALYCENYLEGFHIPYVHKSLNEIVDFGTYATETHRFSSMQTGYDRDKFVAGRYLFIFPNLMFNFYPWGISVNIVEPVTPGSSRIRFLSYVADESKLQTGAGGDLHRVELEDEAVVESVQKGIRSRSYDRGRYSPTREQGTHHFHRLIAEFMG